jgi:hypothetical protein
MSAIAPSENMSTVLSLFGSAGRKMPGLRNAFSNLGELKITDESNEGPSRVLAGQARLLIPAMATSCW